MVFTGDTQAHVTYLTPLCPQSNIEQYLTGSEYLVSQLLTEIHENDGHVFQVKQIDS